MPYESRRLVYFVKLLKILDVQVLVQIKLEVFNGATEVITWFRETKRERTYTKKRVTRNKQRIRLHYKYLTKVDDSLHKRRFASSL